MDQELYVENSGLFIVVLKCAVVQVCVLAASFIPVTLHVQETVWIFTCMIYSPVHSEQKLNTIP